MRSVSVRLADLDRVKINLGIAGENEHTHVLFDCKKAFDQYPNATPFLIVTPPRGDIYPTVVTRDGDIVEWVVTDSDLIYHGNGKVQLQFKQGDIIMKSYEARTSIAISSEPTGTVPTPIQNWITQANAILASIPDDIAAALAEAKASGQFDGADGVGIASITLKSTVGLVDTYTITLTDGRDYDFTVTNGTPGQNGVGIQSIAKTSTVGLVDTYTVTLTNGQTYPFTVTNGQNGVEIDDTTPANNKVFSSAKVDEELTDVKTAIQGKYTKPSGGIPATDLEQAVQTSLGNADTAYQKPNSGIPASDMASGVIPVLTDLLDDTAGENDTDKTWSADKLFKLESFVEEASLSPAQIQTIVADGRASEFFSIGDIIIIPWTDYSQATAVTYDSPFVVANIADCVDDNGVTHHNALWLQAMVATPQTIQFDAPEQIVATEETFQHGMYYYTKNADDSFTEQSVTAGDPIPTGTTYYKHYRTGMSGRLRYGSNSYKESAIRQWLNSSGAKNAWWTAQHESDVAPTQHSSVPGYLAGFNDDWLSVIKPVEVKCYRNMVCDDGGWDTMYDRFFLPSLEEVYGSPQLSGEGVYFLYWKEETGLQSPSNGSSTDTNDARKIPSVANKYGSAVYVWLRSANRYSTYSVWNVNSTGYLSNYGAFFSYRFLPACVIY